MHARVIILACVVVAISAAADVTKSGKQQVAGGGSTEVTPGRGPRPARMVYPPEGWRAPGTQAAAPPAAPDPEPRRRQTMYPPQGWQPSDIHEPETTFGWHPSDIHEPETSFASRIVLRLGKLLLGDQRAPDVRNRGQWVVVDENDPALRR